MIFIWDNKWTEKNKNTSIIQINNGFEVGNRFNNMLDKAEYLLWNALEIC